MGGDWKIKWENREKREDMKVDLRQLRKWKVLYEYLSCKEGAAFFQQETASTTLPVQSALRFPSILSRRNSCLVLPRCGLQPSTIDDVGVTGVIAVTSGGTLNIGPDSCPHISSYRTLYRSLLRRKECHQRK